MSTYEDPVLIAKPVAVQLDGGYVLKMLAITEEGTGRIVSVTHDPDALASSIADELNSKSIKPLVGEVQILTRQLKLVGDHLSLLTKQVADMEKKLAGK